MASNFLATTLEVQKQYSPAFNILEERCMPVIPHTKKGSLELRSLRPAWAT
jgi:hypothetical protein